MSTTYPDYTTPTGTVELTTAPAHRAASDISPKVSGSLAAAAVATIVVFAAQQFGLAVPVGVEGAVATLVAALAGYFIPDRR